MLPLLLPSVCSRFYAAGLPSLHGRKKMAHRLMRHFLGSLPGSAQLEFLQDCRRNFLDRLGRGVQPADAFAAHHLFSFGNLETAVGQRGVIAGGAAFFANLMQALGLDGQAEQLGAMFFQRAGQAAAVEIFRDQREIGGLEAELHGQIERGRRLAAARDGDQDHVGLGEIAVGDAVIVGQRVVDRLDAIFVV